ncbi:MAG: ribosome maturation factor RimP [Actinobacteria bacterium]|nr:ribosome maturation factor RimP [Actinomycetota bacterium]
MAAQRDTALEAHVRDLAEPLAAAAELELVDVEVKGHPGSRLVRLVVDADQGVDVEACATLSHDIGVVLDRTDTVPGRYILQVSSPGVDRPLVTRRDFARNVGRPVRVVTRPETSSPSELTGVVVAVDDEAVTLEVDDAAVSVALVDVQYARVALPW